MTKYLLLAFFACMSVQSIAQTQPILEQNPPSLRWFQIRTPKFRIIFPEGMEHEAQRTANTMETVYSPVSATLQREPRPISIILQNQTAISNGFVTITPRHSEFFTLPPQDYALLGTNDWIDLLAVHEFRHVVQYDKALRGLSKIFYYLFGGSGLAVTANLAVPGWYWEGDAVGTETALTTSGRGRIPAFYLDFRTFLLTKGPYSYQKAYLGSYRDYITGYYNRYKLGYFMTSHVKRKYGPDAWSNVLNRTYDFPFWPFVFSRSIKKELGLRVQDVYDSTMLEMKGIWEKQLENLPVTEATTKANGRNRVYTSYEFPQFLSDGRILAQKSGLADVETFVILGDSSRKREEKVFVPGYINDSGMLSVVNDKLVWSESAFDPRWSMRDYTVIKTYDIKNNKLKQITHKTRLSAPALSPDGSKIAAVQVSVNNEYNLVILDATTGERLNKLNNPDNNFYLMPRWSPDGKQMVAVVLNRKGKTIQLIDVATGNSQDVIPYNVMNIAHPVMYGNYIYFNSPFNGIDNIYAVNITTGQQYQVTSRKFGAYNPAVSPDGKTIAFNDFTQNGFRIATMPNDTTQWTPLNQVEDRTIDYHEPLIEQEGNRNIVADIPGKKYEINKYNKFRHIFNPYSWSPLAASGDNSVTLSITSQDLLNTALANIGVGYDGNERTGSFFTRLSYQGFYPILDAEFETTARNTGVTVRRQGQEDTVVRDIWREQILSAGFRLPFNFTHSRFSESLNLSAHTNISNVSDRMVENRNGLLHSMRYSLSYQRLHKRSIRDINPKWGQTLAIYYRNTPFGGDFKSELFAVQGNLLFPGLMKHHSFRLRAGYQTEMPSVYPFSTPLTFTRGYSYVSHKEYYNGSVEYRFPLFNPDWAIGKWLYFKRFKGNAFFDYGTGKTGDRTLEYRSIGFDLSTEFHFMRLFVPFELGIRSIYFPLTNTWSFQSLVLEVGF
ncbi:hypothetical protein GXP67_15960 [Rhodocytophaga rosea]|uniref:Uncharacterized protein n=1 Tax=Rhodocytophaga rosea TaxID=2704465 RepID=A0A6C0GJA4_9BACT|nr:PD40 domain-containing protein [Rhodocytophaga rosea]QHT68029.1 hypothetical protein GXP67_15960 [Rhodocytophaga rosea]